VEQKTLVGKVVHFYPRISVAVVHLTQPLLVGDRVLVEGRITRFEQTVESMQIQHVNVQRAEAGQLIGLKVIERAREGDSVYKIAAP